MAQIQKNENPENADLELMFSEINEKKELIFTFFKKKNFLFSGIVGSEGFVMCLESFPKRTIKTKIPNGEIIQIQKADRDICMQQLNNLYSNYLQ